jgi:polar amino acid transport system substrate-binding protein
MMTISYLAGQMAQNRTPMKHQMKPPNLCLLLVGLLLSLASFIVSAGPVDCGTKPISLAFFVFGYGYYEEDGQAKGLFKDVADEFTRRTGCSFITQVMPIPRIWEDVANGKLDVGIASIQTVERDQYSWIVPYLATKSYALIRVSTAGKVRTAEDFLDQKELLFGVVRGWKYGIGQEKWLEKMRQAGRVEESASYEILFEKLKAGRVDGLFSAPNAYRKMIKDLHLDAEIAIHDWFEQEKGIPGGFMLSKNRFSEAEALRWKAVIREMRSDGTLERMFRRYYTPQETRNWLDF